MLVGKMIVGVTLAGYDATPQNVTKVIALIRKENAATRAALAASGDQQRSAAATFRLVFGTKYRAFFQRRAKSPGMSASLRLDRSNAFTERSTTAASDESSRSCSARYRPQVRW